MNPYSRMAEIMEERGAARNGYEMEVAVVTKVSPLAIKIGEVEISVNLCCHPALMLGMNPAAVPTSETALKQCLTNFYGAFQIHAGDKVLIQRVGNRFFVLCKVVDV
ncbi:hypothetical protein D7X87_20600 [bacterium D16-54]|nr:hypothetical protein D7X87_20600 [bacterium D16-54]RKJ11717.1 hypothetical protein D7X65_21035 [bacterium D16-56]